jgi:hypothetical protein
LTKEEFEKWKSQIVTSKIYSQEEIHALKMSARRCPYAFTEQGVAQLSAVLHSDVAEDASVRILDVETPILHHYQHQPTVIPNSQFLIPN